MSYRELVQPPINSAQRVEFHSRRQDNINQLITAALTRTREEFNLLEDEFSALKKLLVAVLDEVGPVEISDAAIQDRGAAFDKTIYTEYNHATHTTKIWSA